MFFFLSKTLDSFASPLGLGLSLIVISYIFRKRLRARLFAYFGFFIVYIFSLQMVSNGLWRFLERSARHPPQTAGTYDVVIILGGMVDDAVMARRHHSEYNEHIDRLIRGADILRQGDAREALLSGGEGRPDVGIAEAEQLRTQLIDWGIAPDRLVTEARSRNTHENAVFSAAIIRQHGWKRILLVTSAFHMQRALGCFAKEGILADAAPADFHGARIALSGDFFLPRGTALAESSAAWRELVGRIVYRLVGYSVAV